MNERQQEHLAETMKGQRESSATQDATVRERRAARVVGTHPAGPDHQVVTVVTTGEGVSARCQQVCEECPWRRDSPIGAFPAEAYRHSATTAYDGALNTFACHMRGKDAPTTCAGFLLRNAVNNIGVRLAVIARRLSLTDLRETVPLYDSYREMAIANGVSPDDPALVACRANDE